MQNKLIQSVRYSDLHASGELKEQMLRYSRDRESAGRTALEFAIWLLRRLEFPQAAEIIEREMKEVFADSNNSALKIADQKSLLTYAYLSIKQTGYGLTALVLENHLVERYGELDDIQFNTIEEKDRAEKEERERVLENIDMAKTEDAIKIFSK